MEVSAEYELTGLNGKRAAPIEEVENESLVMGYVTG